jgi:hypothetical protein
MLPRGVFDRLRLPGERLTHSPLFWLRRIPLRC